MKKRWIVCMLMAFVLILGSTVSSFGSVSSASVSVNRLSNTKADTSASATFDGIASSCSVKIILQEKYNGSWRTATGVPVTAITRTSSNTSVIGVAYTFTLVKGKVYRTKNIFKDTRGSTTWTKSYYSKTF